MHLQRVRMLGRTSERCGAFLVESLFYSNRTPAPTAFLLKCKGFLRGELLDKNFTFRFYDISRPNPRTPAMVDMLRQIADIPQKDQREKLLSSDYTVRLETLEDQGQDAVVGELTRCQNTNLPSEIDAGARRPLEVDRLGHSVVFRLNHRLGVLGIQYDSRVVSPGRLLDYIAAFNAGATFRMDPRLDPQAWAKFNNGPTRKLSIRVANPENMGNLDGTSRAASDSLRAMSDAYDAPSIYVEISMGHHRGFLADGVNALARQLAAMNFPGVRLDSLSAVTVVNDSTEEIDLLEQRVVAKETLSIDDRDPDRNWVIKRNFLIQEMIRLVG